MKSEGVKSCEMPFGVTYERVKSCEMPFGVIVRNASSEKLREFEEVREVKSEQ